MHVKTPYGRKQNYWLQCCWWWDGNDHIENIDLERIDCPWTGQAVREGSASSILIPQSHTYKSLLCTMQDCNHIFRNITIMSPKRNWNYFIVIIWIFILYWLINCLLVITENGISLHVDENDCLSLSYDGINTVLVKRQ